MPELGCSNTRGLVALPNDILLKILDGLDPQSAARFGQICKCLHVFATSRPAWLGIARIVSRTGVLPLPLHKSYPSPASLSTDAMKIAIRRGITAQHVLGRSSPVAHVHPYLGVGSGLPPSLAYSLQSDHTVVHTAFLPGGRFLLTVQLDSSFACWDLKAPTRTRCVRLQTGLGANVDEERVEPRCIAYWRTGGAYVEFAHDMVEEGDAVIVGLLVVNVIPDQPALDRQLHVLRIELPNPSSRRRPPRPIIPDESMYNMRLLASAPIPHPLFVCSSYVNASGHAGLIGNAGSEVIFVLFFNPRPPPDLAPSPVLPTFAEAAVAVHALANSRVALIQCSFKTKPTRFYALGSAERIILYCESGGCIYSYAHSVAKLRAQAFARSADAGTLDVPSPPPHEDPFPSDEQGTPDAPHIQKMCVMLRKSGPAWLEHGADWVDQVAQRSALTQQEQNGGPAVGTTQVCALSMTTVDPDTSNLDAFRGLVIGVHDVDVGRKHTPATEDSIAASTGEEASSSVTHRPHHMPHPPSPSPPLAALSLDPPSSPASSTSTAVLPDSTAAQPYAPPQPPRYRRECRVRYKRTVFPSHLTCTWHELAALGTHGRRAVWIEGDGPPPPDVEGDADALPYDESASLRVMLASVGDRTSPDTIPREVSVPPGVRANLGDVSCLALDDSTGALALATMDGRVMLVDFA